MGKIVKIQPILLHQASTEPAEMQKELRPSNQPRVKKIPRRRIERPAKVGKLEDKGEKSKSES